MRTSTRGAGQGGNLASSGARPRRGRNGPSPPPPFRAASRRRQRWRRTGGGPAASGRWTPSRGPIGSCSSPWPRLRVWRRQAADETLERGRSGEPETCSVWKKYKPCRSRDSYENRHLLRRVPRRLHSYSLVMPTQS